jgi:hypothetical protein
MQADMEVIVMFPPGADFAQPFAGGWSFVDAEFLFNAGMDENALDFRLPGRYFKNFAVSWRPLSVVNAITM